MLIHDFRAIGNKLYAIRKKSGLTQAEVAERADLSDRTYADIERGTVNMRVETVLRICDALHVTPDEILTKDGDSPAAREEQIFARLEDCPPKDHETALRLLEVYLQSLDNPE